MSHTVCTFTTEELRELVKGHGFITEAKSREEAYQAHVAFENGFEAGCRTDLTFEEFCTELDKGYCGSSCVQVARLCEVDGVIYYDNEFA